jgi:predicted permease
MLHSLRQDILYAVRSFLKTPGLSAAVVVSIGLGIAANATVFSMVNALILRDLPVRDSARVVALARGNGSTFSYPDYRDFRDQSRDVFEGVAAHFAFVPANLNAGGVPQRIWGQLVSGNYFPLLGIQPSFGRGILPRDDEAPGKTPVIVLGYGLWQRLGRDPALVGKTIVLSGLPYTVVGVAPLGFRGIDRIITPDFWAPLSMFGQLSPDLIGDGENRGAHWLEVSARLKPGVTRAQAAAAINVINARINAEHEKARQVVPIKLQRVGQIPELHNAVVLLMSTLSVVVGLLLLISCANVANLLLARAAGRQHEIGIRLAVGASRGRVVRQLLTESVLLAGAGAAVGFALATFAATLLARVRLPLPLPIEFDVRPDGRVLAFTAFLALLTGILFGLAPALTGARGSLTEAIRRTGWSWGGFRRGRLASLLVALQVTFSLVLLVASGLFIRSFQKAAAIDIGMNPEGVLMLSLDAKTQGYSQDRSSAFFRQLEERVTALPGVRSMSYVDIMPLSLASSGDSYHDADHPSARYPANEFRVGPHYFQTLGIAMAQGRDFSPQRDEKAAVAVINEALASRLFGRESAVGRHIRKGDDPGKSALVEVIGVVRNTKAETLGEDAAKACVFTYLPADFNKAITFFGVTVLVKTGGNTLGMLRSVREQVEALDPNMPVFNTKTMVSHVNEAMLIPRVCAALFGLCGTIGLLLATVGLYGVISYSVRMRTREIGIRMALGAPAGAVGGMVARQGLTLVGISVAVGVAIALALSRIVGSLLWGVSPTDPLTFIGVPAILMLVAGVAILLPARRASRIDPIAALRTD